MPSPTNSKLPFDPKEISRFPVLGEGVWGSVIDLQNGTVLKVARERCAGIGNGRQKIEREFGTLSALHSRREPSDIFIPDALGYGNIPGAAHPNPTIWLQTTKAPGLVRKVSELRGLSGSEMGTIASSIGVALSNLHRDLGKVLASSQLDTTTNSLRNAQKEFCDDPQAIEFMTQVQEILERSTEDMVIHGDFNISNLLFDKNRVVSILDFAETRCGFYEEDLASIIAELPTFQVPLITAYQDASGYQVDERRLLLAQAIFELFTFVISNRQKDANERSGSQMRLSMLFEQLK